MKRLLSSTTMISIGFMQVSTIPVFAEPIALSLPGVIESEVEMTETGALKLSDGRWLCYPAQADSCLPEMLAAEAATGVGLDLMIAKASVLAEAAGEVVPDPQVPAEVMAEARAELGVPDPVAEAQAAEAARLAEEQAKADEAARLAEEQAKADEAARLAEEQAKADEAARLAEEQAKADEVARLAEEQAKADEAARLAEEQAKADEAARLAEEQAKAEEAARLAEEQAKADEAAKLAEELAKAEEAAKASETAPAVGPTANVEATVEPAPAPTTEDEAARLAEEAARIAEEQAKVDQANIDEVRRLAEEAARIQAEQVVELTPEEEAALAAAAAVEAEKTKAEAELPVAEPVAAPEVTADEQVAVETLLASPDSIVPEQIGAAAAAVAEATGQAPAATEVEPQQVTETEVTAADTRSSFEEFAAAPKVAADGSRKGGLSDLEKVGLVALGALVVGAVLNNGQEVVANSGDRVVIKNPDGDLQVYKDDDTLLRRPGSTVRTETYRDGSTRTTVLREDGTKVVTIRDASGRVLRRASYDERGRELVLIDDLQPEERIEVTQLPPPPVRPLTISTADSDAAFKAEMAKIEAERIGRTFSLRQIRDIREVRRLAAVIDVDNITFDTNSAVIRTTEARKLAALGRTMQQLLDENPREIFLIEGHTDAVGSAASNLALSDRRAESVALALTEYFGVPPENMVVQGYGESDLRINTPSDERLNRRAAVRVISPLMRTAELR